MKKVTYGMNCRRFMQDFAFVTDEYTRWNSLKTVAKNGGCMHGLKSSNVISLDDELYTLVAYALPPYAVRPGDLAHATAWCVGIIGGANMTYLRYHRNRLYYLRNIHRPAAASVWY